ncbi:MAG: hypothetical protein AB1724_08775 [Thermodesulfobacteriota bacterium]
MNGKQITILAVALAASGLILWHDLPLEFPWVMLKVLMLFLKLFAVLAVAVFAYVAAGKKKPS